MSDAALLYVWADAFHGPGNGVIDRTKCPADAKQQGNNQKESFHKVLSVRADGPDHLAGDLIDPFHRGGRDPLIDKGRNLRQAFFNLGDELVVSQPGGHTGQELLEVAQQVGLI